MYLYLVFAANFACCQASVGTLVYLAMSAGGTFPATVVDHWTAALFQLVLEPHLNVALVFDQNLFEECGFSSW